MYKNKLFLLVLVAFISVQSVSSQNNTNSPYTRFGYGDISDTNNGEQRALGGVAIGSRSINSINSINPASYSTVDSTTFMFDIGAAALISRFSETKGSVTKKNANLEYITMQFPLTKWLGFSAGALPYSFVGYDFYTSDSIPMPGSTTKVLYTQNFLGNGGFTQVYSGISANLFNHISLGVNAYYMFGTINNYRSLAFTNTTENTSTTESNTLKANNFRFRFGAQIYNTFAQKHDVTLGFIFEPKAKLNGGFTQISTGVLTDSVPPVNGFETPTMYGIGLYYTYDNRLSVGLDYSMQQWQNAQYDGKTNSLNNRSKLAIGVEYLPNPRSRNLIDRIRYRGGFNMSDSYFNVNGQSLPKNYGISCGLGLPLRNSKTILNASFEYGKIGSMSLLKEDYFKITFNATFNEHWFFKRKL